MNPKLISALALAVAVTVVIVIGCQTYDFQPVPPFALSAHTQSTTIQGKQLKPNLMLVIDKSGSMWQPIDPTNSACDAGSGTVCGGSCVGGGTCNTAVCPTRISEVSRAMSGFLADAGTVARMGLTSFPHAGGDGCIAASLSDIAVPIAGGEDDATLQAQANAVAQGISAITPCGGTPTAATLTTLGSYTPLLDPNRSNFILLNTDGEPNCNPSNPNTCASPAACKCTIVNGTCGSPGAPYCVEGCLDQDGTVAAIQGLKTAGIKTIVIGFGSETLDGGAGTGNAPAALNAMAAAGGFPRRCPNGTDAECAPADTCQVANHLCNRMYFQASDSAALIAALIQIGSQIGPDPCKYILDPPPANPQYLSVLVNGTAYATGPDTWVYDGVKLVTLVGNLCAQVSNSTSPSTVEFRVVQPL